MTTKTIERIKEIKEILNNTFSRKIELEEESHTYYVEGEAYPGSTTTELEQFKDKFDEDKMSKLVAKRDKKSQSKVKAEWKGIRDEASERGRAVHYALEIVGYNLSWLELYFEDILAKLKDKLTEKEYKYITIGRGSIQFMSGVMFYEWLQSNYKDRFHILSLEQKLFYPRFKHCGTADIILYDSYNDTIVIADWKTNKDIFNERYYSNHPLKYMKYPFNNLIANQFNTYALQFSHYQMMIEEMTNLKVSDRWLIWLKDSPRVNNYCVHASLTWAVYSTGSYAMSLFGHYNKNLIKTPNNIFNWL